MSELLVTSIYNQEGEGAPSFPKGATSTGVITATSFSGSGANLTGIDATALKDDGGNVKIQANSTGAVVTGILTTTGPVTIGGTLTYEDVTNIDSVGLITARDGLKVTGGNLNVGTAITAYGSTGIVSATSYRGDGSQLSGIEAAPTITGIASTSIAVTDPVVIQQDGTFTTVVGYAASDGPGTQFVSQRISYSQMLYDESTDRWVIMYRREQNATFYARVGTKVGQTMTWSSPVQSHPNASGQAWADSCIVAPGKVIIICGAPGTVQVGTIDGPNNTISFGSGVNCEDSTDFRIGARICKVADNKAAVIYGTTAGYTVTRIITVSGTTPTIHTKNQFLPMETKQGNGGQSIAFDESTDRLILGSVRNSGSRLECWAASISGNTITVGNSSGFFDSGDTDFVNLIYSKFLNKIVLFYRDTADNNKGIAHVMTTNAGDLSIGIGSKHIITQTSDNVEPGNLDVSFDGKGRFCMTYRNGSDGNRPCYTQGSFSSDGSSFTLKQPISNRMFADACKENFARPVGSDGKGEGRWVSAYAYDSANDSGYFILQLNAANFNTGNMVGFPKEAYTTGQTATIKVVGNVATGLSGLTPGKRYYVQSDGTVGTAAMADNAVVAGQALSSTSLLIQSP